MESKVLSQQNFRDQKFPNQRFESVIARNQINVTYVQNSSITWSEEVRKTTQVNSLTLFWLRYFLGVKKYELEILKTLGGIFALI